MADGLKPRLKATAVATKPTCVGLVHSLQYT